MKTIKKYFRQILVIATFMMLVVTTGFVNKQDDIHSSWKAPASADKLENPFKADDAGAIKSGKKIFKNMCAICHGSKGKGDGMAGMSLNPRPTNFTTEKTQSQSDGAIFWKMTEGRAPMASYKKILKEEQRWQLVSFIRSLKK